MTRTDAFVLGIGTVSALVAPIVPAIGLLGVFAGAGYVAWQNCFGDEHPHSIMVAVYTMLMPFVFMHM